MSTPRRITACAWARALKRIRAYRLSIFNCCVFWCCEILILIIIIVITQHGTLGLAGRKPMNPSFPTSRPSSMATT
ncbi:uncharacterized protein BT62DRAFT_1009146 [Guyanagaster necrorhizus]|uniref:Uncharacterized protein n=1 Tax=Guyanagaster necrorhizus TaxID=856835 RepID=A0A9P7VLH6_9AGAR|nr:uncharacterized protein BT62DRAFT_1009146 [Guyanagaster necrorhizus MCA 3950]KAG7443353.1 hypothetical protein BT62DRAFT_1009146 [Guyanagaster necrorhizus MCA 3950]